MSSFTFNSISSTLAAHKITSVMRADRPLSPGQEAKLLRILGRDGAYFLRKDRNVKSIPVLVVVQGATIQERQAAIRAISAWVDTDEAAALIFYDEPNLRDMCHGAVDAVIPDNVSPTTAYVMLNFTNYDSYSESTSTSTASPNNGTMKTPVKITATMVEDASSLKIIASETGEYILLTTTLVIGDEIIIDTNTRTVTLNGADARGYVSFGSTKGLKLPVGAFSFTAVPASTTTAAVFRERWK